MIQRRMIARNAKLKTAMSFTRHGSIAAIFLNLSNYLSPTPGDVLLVTACRRVLPADRDSNRNKMTHLLNYQEKDMATCSSVIAIVHLTQYPIETIDSM